MYSEVQCIMGNGHMETPLINESLKFKGHFLFEMQTDMGLTDGHLIVSFICRVFFEMHKNGNNANIGSRGFTTWKQKNPVKNVTPGGNRTQASHNLWFQVQHSPFWSKLTFACKTETLGSLYSHALLILTESSKSKN